MMPIIKNGFNQRSSCGYCGNSKCACARRHQLRFSMKISKITVIKINKCQSFNKEKGPKINEIVKMALRNKKKNGFNQRSSCGYCGNSKCVCARRRQFKFPMKISKIPEIKIHKYQSLNEEKGSKIHGKV